ncbi:hypothetical protein [Amycolatopsis sp. NPDC058986]|uniref:hypothetical protein n=1 Tax=unclassified Amycolatopsis TaxID=2618356 RepID=UPI00366E800C
MTSPDIVQHHPSPARPASATPVADYLNHQRRPGTSPDAGYVVLPRGVLERLPLPLQQRVAQVLAEVHQAMPPTWTPAYRVTPSRWAKVGDLEEHELTEIGVSSELSSDGDLVYRAPDGSVLAAEDLEKFVLVSAADPLQRGVSFR